MEGPPRRIRHSPPRLEVTRHCALDLLVDIIVVDFLIDIIVGDVLADIIVQEYVGGFLHYFSTLRLQ